MMEYADGVTEIATKYEGLRLLYTDGKETSGGTMDVTDLERGEKFNGPALLEHADFGADPVLALLFLDRTWLEVVDIVVLLTTDQGVTVPRRLVLEELSEDVIVTPLYEVLAPDGEVSFQASKPLRWGKGLTTSMALVPPGEYAAALLVEQMNGRVTQMEVDYRVVAHEGLDVLVDNWKNYRPDLLPGKWKLSLLGGDGTLAPTTVEFDIEALKLADYFAVTGRDTSEGGVTSLYAWRLDRTGLPNICFVEVVDGREAGGVLCPAFLADRDGELVLILHMVALDGSVWVLQKMGGAGALRAGTGGDTSTTPSPTTPDGLVPADHPARFVPVETPAPQPVRG
jgi:hypothetical protein